MTRFPWGVLAAIACSFAGGCSAQPAEHAAAPRAEGAPSPTASSSARPALHTLDPGMFLGSVEVVEDRKLRGREIILEVQDIEGGGFGELSRRGLATKVGDRQLRVELPARHLAPRDLPGAADRACSFLIDCDDAVFSTPPLAFADGAGAATVAMRIDGLVELTGRHVSRKTLARGFDVASEVAREREGDCTEHATLLAALARRHGLAARVVLGVVLLEWGKRAPELVGHAWVEIHDGREWVLADAALPAVGLAGLDGFERITYLPVQLVAREDAGFMAGMLEHPGLSHITRVRVPPR